jgi:TolB-like protein/class 3 adenylate cyclase
MEKRLPRKLAAILYADVVEYSRLTGEDEDATHRTLSEYLDQIANTVEIYNGSVMHYAGDAVLARFEAVVDVLSCAAQIQLSLEARNLELPTERNVRFRMGVNLGDVIEDRGDIYGDGVNVAARLESLAETGGICISESVHTAIGNKLPFDYEFLGERDVKNIAKPVKAYHARLKPGAVLPEPSVHLKSRKPKQITIATAVITVVLIFGAGVIAWWQPWQPEEDLASIERMAFPLPDKPSIAVLPFTNMSDDPSQDYFVDGMTDDLITDLSKLSGLFVIARNTVFTYRNQPVKIRQVAEELGVRYVLEGSVRRSGEQIRVNAQLIDATTGGHVWADRYDGDSEDIFSVQDAFVREIVKALAVNLSEDELTEIALGQTSNIEAREIFQKGWENYQRYSADDNAVAISQFEKALGLDPEYERAYAGLGLAYLRACKLRWNQPLAMSTGDANLLALSNLKFLNEIKGKPSSLAKVAASRIYLYNNRYEEAVAEATRAIAQDPNDPEAYIAMAWAMITTGNPEAGLELVERAMRLNPSYPNYYALARGMAYFAMDDLDKAANVFAEVLEREPDAIQLAVPLAATYAHLGKRGDARAAILLWEPGANQHELSNIRYSYHFPYEWSGDDSVMDRLFAGLKHAVLPLGVTVTSLIDTLSHDNEFERQEAIRILRQFGPAAEPAVPALIEVLKAEDIHTRSEAVITLGVIGPAAEAAIPFLEVLLEEEGSVGYRAANALGKIEGL